jgi:hypothetical protein
MAANIQRSTPGVLLIVWAVLLTGVVIFTWRVRLHAQEYNWTDWPTGLGDHAFYTKLSDNDFYTPALVFTHHEGLFRRQTKPVVRDDARMQRLTMDASKRVFVYADPNKPGAFYLKAGEDQYIEFGERRFWQKYEAPKAIPVSKPE